jgi:hypothetical protein
MTACVEIDIPTVNNIAIMNNIGCNLKLLFYGPRHVCVPHVRCQFLEFICNLCFDPSISKVRPHILITIAYIIMLIFHLLDRLHIVQ